MNDVTYCKSWFRAKKSATQIWDGSTAKEAHESRQPYTVLVGDSDRPRCFIEINGDFVGCCFFHRPT